MMSNKDQQNKQQQQQQPGGGGMQQQHGQQQASYQPQGMQQQGMQPQTHQQGRTMGGSGGGAAQFQMHPQGGSMMHGSGAGTQGSMGGQMGGQMGGTSGGRQGMEGHGMMGSGMGGTSGGMQGMEGGGQQRMGMGGMEGGGGQQRMGMGGMEGGGQQRMGMGGMEGGGQQRMGMGGMEGGGGQQRMGMGGMEGGGGRQQHHRMEAGGQQRGERRGSASEKGMCIGIIGTGEEGSTLIRKLSKHGYKVCMANDQQKSEHMSQFSKETGACPCDLQDVVKNCDMVFLSIPEKAITELPKGLFQNASKDLVVVDCCNYYPHRDGHIKELDSGSMPESVWVQNQIGRPVVKAFNAILAGALHDAGCPKGSHERIAVPYAGDDARAKSMVAKVIEDLGFDAYDCGELSQSWKFQPGSPAYCTHLTLKEMESAIRGAKKEDLPRLRDEAYQKMTSSQRHMDWRALSQMLRETYQTHKHIGGGMEKEKQQMGAGAQHMQQPTSA